MLPVFETLFIKPFFPYQQRRRRVREPDRTMMEPVEEEEEEEEEGKCRQLISFVFTKSN
jgi:hypothetical protein